MLSTGSFMRFEIFYFSRCPVPSMYFIFAPLGVPASFLFYFCAAGSSVPHSYFIFAPLGTPCLIPILFLRRWELRVSFLFYFCAAGSSVPHSYFILRCRISRTLNIFYFRFSPRSDRHSFGSLPRGEVWCTFLQNGYRPLCCTRSETAAQKGAWAISSSSVRCMR